MNMCALILMAVLPVVAALPVLADGPQLPGHALSAQDARAQADTVFAGKLVSLDPAEAKALHGEFVGKVVYLARAANGLSPAIATQDGAVRTPLVGTDLGIPVRMTVAAGETAPRVGRSYLFYAKDDTRPGGQGYVAVKLVPTGSEGLPSRNFSTGSFPR